MIEKPIDSIDFFVGIAEEGEQSEGSCCKIYMTTIPIEEILTKSEFFKRVHEDTERECRFQVEADYDEPPELSVSFPFKTNVLESNVAYIVKGESCIGVYGIEILEGSGEFIALAGAGLDDSGTQICRFSKDEEGECNVLFGHGLVFPYDTDFCLYSKKGEHLKYKLVCSGINNPQIQVSDTPVNKWMRVVNDFFA